MPPLPERPCLTWKEIEKLANAFCEKFRLADREYPLDLEELANFDLGIEIRLVDGLQEDCGTPAHIALSSDGPVITVDAAEYHANTGFYRYSLAHEIAHWVLHRGWLEAVYRMIESVEDWKAVFRSIHEDDYHWIESQAEECAAYIIAPPPVFDPFLEQQFDKIRSHLDNLDLADILPYLANPVSLAFGMTSSAAQARIRKSQVWKALQVRPGQTEKRDSSV